jgi:NADPH2:quinone reductase
MQTGVVAETGGEYPLADAARAQADLEGRTTGNLLLIPCWESMSSHAA